MSIIHKTAIIHPDAKLAADVEIGPFTVIGADVTIDSGNYIGSHAAIEGNVKIGKNNRIYKGAAIGMPPQDIKYKNEKSWIEIGDNNIIREFTTIHLAVGEGNKTVIGSNNYLMCNAHVGHNAVIGSNVTLVNGAGIGGFCVLEDRSYVSAFSPIHQFCRVGTLAFVATVSKPDKDVPPFFLVSGNPAEVCGINRVGIDRAGIPESDKEIIKKLYKIFSRSGLNTTQALQKIKTELPQNEHVKHFIEFVESSKRGVYK